jgi:hypothetical protein
MLFGFDVIVPLRGVDRGRLLVVDVNYFPSFKEVADFPSRLNALLARQTLARCPPFNLPAFSETFADVPNGFSQTLEVRASLSEVLESLHPRHHPQLRLKTPCPEGRWSFCEDIELEGLLRLSLSTQTEALVSYEGQGASVVVRYDVRASCMHLLLERRITAGRDHHHCIVADEARVLVSGWTRLLGPLVVRQARAVCERQLQLIKDRAEDI